MLYYFADSSLLFSTVKEFLKSVNSWWSYCKKLWNTVYIKKCVHHGTKFRSWDSLKNKMFGGCVLLL